MKKIFFVTPIGDEGTESRKTAEFVMSSFIAPVAKQLGYEVLKADLLQTISSISESIIEQLERADVIIADITEANPNVMFELGYRMALKKPYLILTQTISSMPFDVRDIRALEYTDKAPNIKDFNNRLKKLLQVIESSKFTASGLSSSHGEQIGEELVMNAIQSGISLL